MGVQDNILSLKKKVYQLLLINWLVKLFSSELMFATADNYIFVHIASHFLGCF